MLPCSKNVKRRVFAGTGAQRSAFLLSTPALVETLKTPAQEPVHSTPAAVTERIALDQARWAGIVKRTNFMALD